MDSANRQLMGITGDSLPSYLTLFAQRFIFDGTLSFSLSKIPFWSNFLDSSWIEYTISFDEN
jgi:hypothetical protein